ncbi:MAG: methionine sulfoxide reductase heme-binding subunit [Thermoleophilales bacterium]|nr:methionine sulfoxide reductase heme-binding subunit [Thermoleophilales bacterium]
MSGSNPFDYPWWLASRSAGIVAFVALTAAVVLGLVMATRLAPVKSRAAVRVAHERLALIALAAVGAHGLFLLGDPWLKPGLSGLLLPFTMSHRPLWTGLGVSAAYLAAALSLTYYVRRRIGTKRWRKAHRFIPIAWAIAAAHMLGTGSDAGTIWMDALFAASVASVGVLLGYRLLKPGPAAPRARRPVGAPPPALRID